MSGLSLPERLAEALGLVEVLRAEIDGLRIHMHPIQLFYLGHN
jgi:hypothetical protein